MLYLLRNILFFLYLAQERLLHLLSEFHISVDKVVRPPRFS